MKDWYYEHISDAKTGEVVRHREELLSHRRNLSKAMGPDPSTIGAKREGSGYESQ
jgi:hypothetical protein